MTPLVLLETERLRLCSWRAEQIDDLMRLHGDPIVARYLSADGKPWTRAQAERALAQWIDLFQSRRFGKLRAERKSDCALVGRAGFSIYPPTGEPEIGFALFQEHWGHGYATEAAAALRDWFFNETDYDRFIGFADIRNAASLAVLRRIGMRPTNVETAFGIQAQFHSLHRDDAHD